MNIFEKLFKKAEQEVGKEPSVAKAMEGKPEKGEREKAIEALEKELAKLTPEEHEKALEAMRKAEERRPPPPGFSAIAGVILGLIILSAVVVGGVLILKKPADKGWLVYRSPNKDFSFKYPKEWELKLSEVDKNSYSQFFGGEVLVEIIEFINGDRESASFGVTTYPANGLGVMDLIVKHHELISPAPVVFPPIPAVPPIARDIITISGLDGLRYKYNLIEDGIYLSTYVLKRENDTIYRLSQNTRVQTKYLEKQKEYDAVLEKILGTFVFDKP